MLENVELQRSELSKPVDERFVRRTAGDKGAYTTGDYVRLMLNQVFGPDNWSHTVLSGPELVRLTAGGAYVKTLVRLTVRFANGQQVVHEDVGVTVLDPGRSLPLDEVAPEHFEVALKAAVTDGLKACAAHLGPCFRPLGDPAFEPPLPAARPGSHPRPPPPAAARPWRSSTSPPKSAACIPLPPPPNPDLFVSIRFPGLQKCKLVKPVRLASCAARPMLYCFMPFLLSVMTHRSFNRSA